MARSDPNDQQRMSLSDLRKGMVVTPKSAKFLLLNQWQWPARLQGPLAIAIALTLFGALGAVVYLVLSRGGPGWSDDHWLIAGLAVGNAAAAAFIGWTAFSLMAHIGRSRAAAQSLEKALSLMDAMPGALYGIDLQGRCNYCNRQCLSILGYDEAAQLLDQDMHALVFAEAGESHQECDALSALREGKNQHVAECLAWRADGSRVAVERWANLVYIDGRVTGIAVALADLSSAKIAWATAKRDQDALELQVRDLSLRSREMAIFGHLAEMLQACASLEEFCRIVAASSKELFAEVSGELYFLEPANLMLDPQFSWGDGDGTPGVAFRPQDCWSIRRGKPHYQEGTQQDIFCAHMHQPLPAFSFCLPLIGQDGNLGLLHLFVHGAGRRMSVETQQMAVAFAHHVALGLSNLKLKETLREEAIRDPVTGLFNRRFMMETLRHEILRAERVKTSVGIIAFDLDNFKSVNDTLGHAAGDTLLAVIANLAKGGLRSTDISCRQGGDEFLLILPDTTENEVVRLAEGLRLKISQFTQMQFPQISGAVSLSAGVAVFPQDAGTPDTLRHAADQALYRAKSLGRDRVIAASGLREASPPALAGHAMQAT